MATIANLSVFMGLNSVAFAAGGKKAMGVLDSIGSAASKLGGVLGGLAAAAGIGLSVNAIADMVTASIEQIDTLKDQAQAIGVTTQALSELQYAATLNGSSSEAVTTALGNMTQRLGQAAVSGGGAATAIADLGLDLRKLASESPDAAFSQIAEAISQISSPTQRAAVAAEIFGKAGRGVVNMLALGSAGLANASEQARRFNASISQVNAEKIGAAKDAMDNFGIAINGAKNALAIELAPVITLATEKLTSFTAQGQTLGDSIAAGAEKGAVAVGYLLDVVDLLRAGWNGAQAAVGKGIANAAKAAATLGRFQEKINGALGANVAGLGFKIPTAELQAFADAATAGVSQDVEEMGAAWNKAGTNVQRVGNAYRKIQTDATNAANAATAIGTERQKQAKMEAQFGATVLDGVQTLSGSIASLWRGATTEISPYLRMVHSLVDATGELAASQPELMALAEQVTAANEEPAARFEKQIAKLREMLSAGLIDQGTFGRAASAAADSFRAGSLVNRGADPSMIRTVERRFTEGQRILAPTNRKEDAVAKAIREEGKKSQELLKQIKGAVTKSGGGAEVFEIAQ